jgi:molybdate transport system ATP-binding protein
MTTAASTRGWVRYRVGGFTLDTAWEAAPGTVAVLYGPSGAGKSMTLRAIAGLVRPQEGRIEVGGRVVFDHETGLWTPPHERHVGYLPQDYGLFPHLTVAGNIAFGARDTDRAGLQRRVAGLVERFHLEGLEERRTWELSGGQRQRVALARALASEPDALLLDEPFTALDVELRRTVRQEIRGLLTSSQVPVLLVTHDAEEALALADTVYLIDDGRIVSSGEPLTVLRQPPQPRIARLAGVENLLSLTVESVRPQDGVMVCRHGEGQRLETPLADARVGERVTIGIRASDVILASQAPQGLSARNVLRARVADVSPRAPGYDVGLDCGEGLRLVCHVTRTALEELGVRPGAEVWAVVKASSCWVLQE